MLPLDGVQRSASFNSDSECPRARRYQFHGSMLLSNRIDKVLTWVSFWISNQIADLSLFAGNGKLAKRGSPPPLKRSWRADRFPPAHQERLYRILESLQNLLAVISLDRVHLLHLNRHELQASGILTMILHQHGGHQLIERVLPLCSE